MKNWGKWEYKENSEIRKLIDKAEDLRGYSEIMKEMYNICNRYLRIFEKENRNDIEDLIEFIFLIEDETEVDNLEEYSNDIENYGFNDIEELIDGRLYEFWNLMDDYNIFIDL